MSKTLRVHFLPELTTAESLRGATVVMIDVLRASSTITRALASGAREVIPCLEVEDVRARGGDLPRDEIVLGGERRGVKIDLFDLGNSPAEYTPDAVKDKTVLFTTTNGTKALHVCREAHQVLIGAPVNTAAVCDAVKETLNVHLLCAGTRGEISREDVLAAGAIVYGLTRKDSDDTPEIDDSAQLARVAWRGVVARAIGAGIPVSQRLAEEFRTTRGGRNLLALGMEADLTACAQVDEHPIVPRLDLRNWSIHLP